MVGHYAITNSIAAKPMRFLTNRLNQWSDTNYLQINNLISAVNKANEVIKRMKVYKTLYVVYIQTLPNGRTKTEVRQVIRQKPDYFSKYPFFE